MQLAKSLIAVVAAGSLGAGAWAALPASAAPRPTLASAPVAASVPAPAPAPAPAKCEIEQWPDRATGQPAGLKAGAATGFYLWHNDEGWHLEVTHPTHDHAVFSGWLSTNGSIEYQRVDDERSDFVKEGRGQHVLSFAFNNYGFLDGAHFGTRCADRIEFHLFVNGRPAAVEQVVVGHESVHPKAMPFTIDRQDVH